MRILVISNLYPPYYIGGYELVCKDIMDRLKARGHEAFVLTSMYGVGKSTVEGNVYRQLRGCGHWVRGYTLSKINIIRNKLKDEKIFRRLIRELKPDIIYVANMYNLFMSLLVTAQREKVPIVYGVIDHWLEERFRLNYWHYMPSNMLKRIIKVSLGKLFLPIIFKKYKNLDLKYVYFASEILKDQCLKAGLSVNDAKIIQLGTPMVQYRKAHGHVDDDCPRLLYVGQVEKHKGVHVAIKAFSILVNEMGYEKLKLSIVGAGTDEEYIHYLNKLIENNNLKEKVKFLGKFYREQIIDIYCEHDVLIFPSIWIEPFGLTILEAMACGLAVVTTATGGNKEFLVHNENSLIFSAGDVRALAEQVECLIRTPALRKKISMAGKKLVREKFDIERMVDEVENFLMNALKK